MIGSAGYLVSFALTALSPQFQSDLAMIFAVPAGVAEVAFLLWLIIRGAAVPAVATGSGAAGRTSTEGAAA